MSDLQMCIYQIWNGRSQELFWKNVENACAQVKEKLGFVII